MSLLVSGYVSAAAGPEDQNVLRYEFLEGRGGTMDITDHPDATVADLKDYLAQHENIKRDCLHILRAGVDGRQEDGARLADFISPSEITEEEAERRRAESFWYRWTGSDHFVDYAVTHYHDNHAYVAIQISEEAAGRCQREPEDQPIQGRERIRNLRAERREALRSQRIRGRERIRNLRLERREALGNQRLRGRERIRNLRAERREALRDQADSLEE